MANQVKKSISKLSYKLNNIIDFNYSTFKVLYVCTFYFWRQLSAETKLFSQVLVMWRDIMSRVQNKLNALQITISTGVLDVLKICNEHLENIKKSLEVNYGTRSAAVLWSSLQNLPQGGHLSVSPSPVPPPPPPAAFLILTCQFWFNENAIKRKQNGWANQMTFKQRTSFAHAHLLTSVISLLFHPLAAF